MKRIFFCCLLLSTLFTEKIFCQTDNLPVGAYPDAIPVTHFPDRLHAFVWRNWNLVSPDAMSETIGCKNSDILKIVASMGLPSYVPVDGVFKKRIYITVIRRNWHLLPYDQLLKLLGMNASALSVALKEDDFLFIKLGSLKPKVAELRYAAPGPKAIARAAVIKKIAEKYFQQPAGVPRFKFIDDLSLVSWMTVLLTCLPVMLMPFPGSFILISAFLVTPFLMLLKILTLMDCSKNYPGAG